MGERERDMRYLETIEGVIEEFGRIQREFVLDKSGIRAITQLIEEMSGAPAQFLPGDPVVEKGRLATRRVVEELEQQHRRLSSAAPPPLWEPFHRSLLRSLELQLGGYREMARVFEDRGLDHLRRGQQMVNQGIGLLSAGRRSRTTAPGA